MLAREAFASGASMPPGSSATFDVSALRTTIRSEIFCYFFVTFLLLSCSDPLLTPCQRLTRLRRSNADSRKAVQTLLDDPEWAAWNSNEVAKRCGVSHTFVEGVRKAILQPLQDTNELTSARTVTRNGTTATMNTANKENKSAMISTVRMGFQFNRFRLCRVTQHSVRWSNCSCSFETLSHFLNNAEDVRFLANH